MSLRRGSTPRQTDWLSVSRKVTLSLTLTTRCLLTEEFDCQLDCDRRSLAVCMTVPPKESGRLYDCSRRKDSGCLYDCGRFPQQIYRNVNGFPGLGNAPHWLKDPKGWPVIGTKLLQCRIVDLLLCVLLLTAMFVCPHTLPCIFTTKKANVNKLQNISFSHQNTSAILKASQSNYSNHIIIRNKTFSETQF
jgi:hypothetical protein